MDFGRSIRKYFLIAAMSVNAVAPVFGQTSDSTVTNTTGQTEMVMDTVAKDKDPSDYATNKKWADDQRFIDKVESAEEKLRIAKQRAEDTYTAAQKNYLRLVEKAASDYQRALRNIKSRKVTNTLRTVDGTLNTVGGVMRTIENSKKPNSTDWSVIRDATRNASKAVRVYDQAQRGKTQVKSAEELAEIAYQRKLDAAEKSIATAETTHDTRVNAADDAFSANIKKANTEMSKLPEYKVSVPKR
jgi:hypothetical protein